MIRLMLRIFIAILVALLLAIAGVSGNAAVLQTLFTVLGIVFSISMSLLVSFSLSKIANKKMRMALRAAITTTRNKLLLDFGIATLSLVITLIWNENYLRITYNRLTIDIMLIGGALVAASLIYEIYNFRKLHKLHTDIEDAVIVEETSKSNRQ